MMASLTAPVGRFFDWWFGELAACVPSSLRGAIGGRRQQIAVDYREHEIELHHRGRAGWRSLGTIAVDRELPAPGRAACAAALRGIRVGAAEIVLRLPAAQVLQRRVELPLAAAENLREVLGFEMDRLTPFRSADVAYDYRVVATDRERQRLAVDLAVAPRALMDDAVSVATTLGLPPDRVGIANGLEAQPNPPNFLTATASGGGAIRRLNVGLAVLLCALLAAAVLWPLERKKAELADLQTRLQASRAEAAAADTLRKQIADMMDRKSFLVQRRQQTPLAVAVLKELTERLADDTWLIQLHIGGGEVNLSGYAPAAAALVSQLEDSALLSDVRFGSPVMPDARVGRERFNLSASIAGAGGS